MHEHSFPLVRLTVENMRHSILAALPEHFDRMKEQTEAALRQTVENFDFSGEVSREAQAVLREETRRTVHAAVNELLRDPRVQERINAAVVEVLSRPSREGR